MKNLSLLVAGLILGSVAQASIITYGGALSGANENLPVVSAGTGFASFTVDTVANTILVNVVFSGLNSADTAAHIHCCTPQGGNTGVATAVPALAGFPLGVTSGSFNNQLFSLLDPTFYNPTFITNNGNTVAAAEGVLLAGLANGQTYFNIHTSTSAGGEIRAFLLPLPEPGTFVLAGLALAGLVFRRMRN
jgi:hypothetical protein